MTRNYLNILSNTIRNNWDKSAIEDFYLTEDGKARDTSRGCRYTYGEMYAELCRVAELLKSLGLQKGDHVAICGANSTHWVIAYLAIAKMQGVSVTVMHSLIPEEIARLVDFSDAKALFTDVDLWSELKNQSLPQVERVIALDNWDVLRGEIIINHQSSIINEEYGFPQSSPDSLAMICYTSGSTGNPKGVMLPMRSISLNVRHGYSEYACLQGQKLVSFIPMAHIYGVVIDILQSLCRGSYIFITGVSMAVNNIGTICRILKPIIIRLVPSVLDQIINKVALDKKCSNLRDRVIQFLGGRIGIIVVGGAGFSIEREQYYISHELPIVSGYGMTECGPKISAVMSPYLYKMRSVGLPIDNILLRISPAGEILVKGENVMLGYYKDPEATARKIDSDGWLHTGDKGHLDEDGYLYVEGRLEQDIIVLPNGENIRPDHIESLINALPEVSESIVFARDGKLVAIAVFSSLPFKEESEVGSLRRAILRAVNPQLPLFSQLYDVEITDMPLQRTEKQTIKRCLYK